MFILLRQNKIMERVNEYGCSVEMRWIVSVMGFGLVCLVPALLILPPLGFAGMVSAIATARGRNTKQLFSIAGFLYTVLMFALMIAWIAYQVGDGPAIAEVILVLLVLVTGFGILIAPVITLVLRMQKPELFRKPEATASAQPSNVPMTPEPETPGQESGTVS